MVVNSVHWFRKCLRLHDNPALQEALNGANTVRCVYILDPWFAGAANVGINRWRFLLEALEDLDCSLKKLNSRLFVVRGQPAEVFPRLFKEWKMTRLTFEYDPEPYGKEKDSAIIKMAQEFGVETIVRNSHTLYNLDRIIEMNNNSPPLTFKRFQTIVSRLELPRRPLPSINQKQMDKCHTKITDNHDQLYSIPSLEELGFRTEGLPPAVWHGGESEALDRLNKHLDKKVWVANFEHPRGNLCSLYASPTGLSPYLRFGCLSCRVLYYNLRELYMKLRKRCSPPLSLFGQLLWREFFYTAATNNPNFDRMDGNPICVQIPWDQNPEALAKWAEGRTGYPWIDAIMTQLREEGWIHRLARHAVACFLTRGDLWISWESGMKVFEELLLDADWSVNAGSWMWLSCSAFFQQFFHCYCPVGFGRRTDPTGDYIRRYIPILKDYPNRYIYEPWNAPESVQKAANCMVGVDYPKPMINHAESSRLNIERMKQVYQQLSHYRGLSLLASVPTIQEEAEPLMTDESQTSSGPVFVFISPSLASPSKFLDEAAGCSIAPDSSTICTSSNTGVLAEQERSAIRGLSHTSANSSDSHMPASAATTRADHSAAIASPPSLVSTPAQTPLTSTTCMPSLLCSTSSSPATTQTSLGPRRKGSTRKVRRGQRQRGRHSCHAVAIEGERRGDEEEAEPGGGKEKMEEGIEPEEERMEEETHAEHPQKYTE
ncbi:cryptochrome-2 isoform X2 [Syngnathoides biaculeatus]|uniref:cryptochrome-2 isoform X2 n=1 Tax=Syngnathoides biaculeatus TaxID=300417 RepID=UPI002ADE3DBC|nr:cryptochrome-2 isoform X2 [Syngnathoides biaculeatus]